MNPLPAAGRAFLLTGLVGWLAIRVVPSRADSATADTGTNEIRIAALQGTADIFPLGATRWLHTQTNEILRSRDMLRTGANSRVTLQWSDQSVVSFGELTVVEVLSIHVH